MFKKFKYVIIIVFTLVAIGAGILIPFVNINYDNSKYLPTDSDAKAGLELLEDEFGNSGFLLVMIDDVSNNEEIKNIIEILTIDNVSQIDYRIKDDKLLLQVVLKENDYSDATQKSIKDIIKILNDENYKYYMNGQSYLTFYYNAMIKQQLPRIIILLVPIVILILILMTSSYAEPLLFTIVIGIAIVINMGTNIFMKNISYLTYSTSPILQLALCMDYSIIFLSRYQHYKKQNLSKEEAVGKAWKTSLIPILSSSLTTVAGFVAIMFMKYRIGIDIGFVLSKGVLLSLLTVIFLLPALILIFDGWIEKTKHGSILSLFKRKKAKATGNNIYNRYIYRARYIVPGLAIIVIGIAFYFQLNLKFYYGDTAFTYDLVEIKESQDNICENFGYSNQVVILFDKEKDTKNLFNNLDNFIYEGNNYITSIYSYTKQYTKREFKEFVKGYNINDDQLDLIFKYINLKTSSKQTISFNELLELIDKIDKFDNKYNKSEMKALIVDFMDITDEEMMIAYMLMAAEEVSVLEMLDFFGKAYSKEEIVLRFGSLFDIEQIDKVYLILNKTKLTLFEIVSYYNESFNAPYDVDTMVMFLQGAITKEELESFYSITNSDTMSIKSLIAAFTNKYDVNAMKVLFGSMGEAKIVTAFGALQDDNMLDTEGKITIEAFVNYINDKFSAFLNAAERELLDASLIRIEMINNYQDDILVLEMAYPSLEMVSEVDLEQFTSFESFDQSVISSQFVGENYQRMILTIDLEDESDFSFGYFENLMGILDETIVDYHIVSSTTTIMGIKETSERDYLITTIISIVLIFIIIAISFKSIMIPTILIIVIQGAIFINMAIPALTNENIIFIGYLIVGCIQLGATIDYGILYTDSYLYHRKQHKRLDAISYATRDSLPTVLTSGLILFVAGIVLAIVSSIPPVAIIGRLIGIGGLISVIMVLFVIPQILYFTDKWFLKKVKKLK